MDLATARRHIEACVERMRVLYARPVFDEWAVLSPGAKHGGVLAYTGPRVESFRQQLPQDSGPLRAQAAGRQFGDGDFEFAPAAGGTGHDALMQLGPGCYLVCNNTGKTMADIRADVNWLKAQKAFFELSEKFRADPLES